MAISGKGRTWSICGGSLGRQLSAGADLVTWAVSVLGRGWCWKVCTCLTGSLCTGSNLLLWAEYPQVEKVHYVCWWNTSSGWIFLQGNLVCAEKSPRYKPEHGLSGVSQEMPSWSTLAQSETLMWIYSVSKVLADLLWCGGFLFVFFFQDPGCSCQLGLVFFSS